jgi:hypothetical protein
MNEKRLPFLGEGRAGHGSTELKLLAHGRQLNLFQGVAVTLPPLQSIHDPSLPEPCRCLIPTIQ